MVPFMLDSAFLDERNHMSRLPLIVLLRATALIGGINNNIPAETRETAVAEHALICQAPHIETLLTDTR
jgi:hypothetical protein